MDEKVQTIANTLNDAAATLRRDPYELGRVLSAVEGALADLKALEPVYGAESYHHNPVVV